MLLRRFTLADADDLVGLDADPEVMRFLTGGKPTPRERVERELLPAILRAYGRRSDRGRFAAVERETGAFVGWLGLEERTDGSDAEAELGYRLRRPAWGKGYATEGSRALIGKAFAELGLERVFAETMAVNLASRRVMEKAGLRLVRTFHATWDDPIEGAEQGEVVYELRRADWEARQAP